MVGDTEGLAVGEKVGDTDGALLVDGTSVGLADGDCVAVGDCEGQSVEKVGALLMVGLADGEPLGPFDILCRKLGEYVGIVEVVGL